LAESQGEEKIGVGSLCLLPSWFTWRQFEVKPVSEGSSVKLSRLSLRVRLDQCLEGKGHPAKELLAVTTGHSPHVAAKPTPDRTLKPATAQSLLAGSEGTK